MLERPDTPQEARMRHEIALAYPGDRWKQRVSRMDQSQVCAVHHRLSTTGKLEEAARERHKKASPPYCKQLSFFDKEYGL